MAIAQSFISRISVSSASILLTLPLALSLGSSPVHASEATEENTPLANFSENCPLEKPALLIIDEKGATVVEEDQLTVLTTEESATNALTSEEVQVSVLLPAGTEISDENLEEIYGAGWLNNLLRAAPRTIRSNAGWGAIQGAVTESFSSAIRRQSLVDTGYSIIRGGAKGACSSVTFGFLDQPCEAFGQVMENGVRWGVNQIQQRRSYNGSNYRNRY